MHMNGNNELESWGMSAESFAHTLIIALKKRLNFVLESEEFKMKE